jgi:hypothetical protein
MSSKRSDEKYIKHLRKIIENSNVKHSKKYNIESVALLLNIPIVVDYNEQCTLIIKDLKKKKKRNKFLKYLLYSYTKFVFPFLSNKISKKITYKNLRKRIFKINSRTTTK